MRSALSLKSRTACLILAAYLLGVFHKANSARAQTAFIPSQKSPAELFPEIDSPRRYVEPVYIDDEAFSYSTLPLDATGQSLASECAGCQTPGLELWTWQILPDGLIYRSYLAGLKESRIGTQVFYDVDNGWAMDVTLGGRVGILRYGSTNKAWPEGWQLDIEGAAFPRLDASSELEMLTTDYRFGVPLTYGLGKFRGKIAYYHLSSHLGDELILRDPPTILASRINYSRDVFVLGAAYFLNPSLRIYGETGYGFYADEGTDPWEFQFGVEYSPADPTGLRGAPFLAVNAHLRQEVDFGGEFSVQTGWQWRGHSGHLMRTGFHYFNGKSNQYEFVQANEQQLGWGLWYDY